MNFRLGTLIFIFFFFAYFSFTWTKLWHFRSFFAVLLAMVFSSLELICDKFEIWFVFRWMLSKIKLFWMEEMESVCVRVESVSSDELLLTVLMRAIVFDIIYLCWILITSQVKDIIYGSGRNNLLLSWFRWFDVKKLFEYKSSLRW